MKNLLVFLLLFAFLEANEYEKLTLKEAIGIVKKKNLEINIAKFNEQLKAFEHKIAKGYSLGKLDISYMIMRTNDALNSFGMKLSSREASFNDFGFDEFLPPLGAMLQGQQVDQQGLLNTQPKNLNFPDAKTFQQAKLSYQVPLYTGGKLTKFEEITKSLQKLALLDREKITRQKVFEVKKAFYDISLLDSFEKNLAKINNNILNVEKTVNEMIAVGYAKKVDLLEVQAKRANVVRMLNQVKSNKKLVYQFLSFLLDSKVKSIADGYENPPMPKENIDEMLDRNLDIKKAKEGLKITSKMIDVEKSSYKPVVGLFAEYKTTDDGVPLKNIGDHDSYTIGVQVKYDIFNGFIDKNRLEKARVANLKMRKQVDLARKGIRLKISKIKTEIENFNFHIDSLKKELELSETIYQNYLGRYKEKLVSINDLMIKESENIKRVLKLKEVQNKRNEKIFELEKIENRGEI